MIREVEFYHIDAFSKEEFRGNPAAVVFGNNLSDKEKKQIAAELNLSETAFLSESKIADYKLQWFTPTMEVSLCGHATLAAVHFLNEKGLFTKRKSVSFKTLSGIINCTYEDGKYIMQLPVPKLFEYYDFKDEILDALNLRTNSISNVPFVMLSNGFLFVTVTSLNVLHSLKPDFKKIIQLSAITKTINEIAVFTTEVIDKTSTAHLRFFAPLLGINEDPVTGSACGPLLLVMLKLNLLKKYYDDTYLTFEQGDNMDRKGRVEVKYNSKRNELHIAGHCVTVMKGKIIL